MSGLRFDSAGRTPPITGATMVALYDPDTGEIFHVHTIIIHEGGQDVPEQEAVERAYSRAKEQGKRTDRVAVKVSSSWEGDDMPVRVDLRTGEFVWSAQEKSRGEGSSS